LRVSALTVEGFLFEGWGFEVEGLRLRVWACDLKFRVWGSRLRVWGSRFSVEGFVFTTHRLVQVAVVVGGHVVEQPAAVAPDRYMPLHVPGQLDDTLHLCVTGQLHDTRG